MTRSLGSSLLLALALTSAAVTAAHAQSPQRGFNFLRTNCARCHSIDKVTPSPVKIAPPFRTLHLKYPIENLEESLAEGIVVGHPMMPQFRLEPDQVGDVIAYLKTLE